MNSTRPMGEDGKVLNCMLLDRMDNVTLTSNGVGTLDGNGERWWGVPGIGFLVWAALREYPDIMSASEGGREVMEKQT